MVINAIHFTANQIWLAVGLLGQGLFFMRFFIQWIASEKRGQSVIPQAFWYFSFLGGVTLFVYAIYKQDPVFMLGQGAGLIIYARNLHLIHRKRQPEEKAA